MFTDGLSVVLYKSVAGAGRRRCRPRSRSVEKPTEGASIPQNRVIVYRGTKWRGFAPLCRHSRRGVDARRCCESLRARATRSSTCGPRGRRRRLWSTYAGHDTQPIDAAAQRRRSRV